MSQTQDPGTIVLAAAATRPGSTAYEIWEMVRDQLPGISVGTLVGILSTAVSRDQLRTEGDPEVRRYFQTPARRRWTVRAGTDGHGADLFEVYAATMEEARASVITTANANMESLLMGGLVDMDGFTVHALERGQAGALPLGQNIYAQFIHTPELANA